MTIEKMTTVVAVDDVAAAVASWATLLGVEPTLVDGTRWAQFDTPAGRVALADATEAPQGTGLMLKVADIDAAHQRCAEAGCIAEPVERGTHERRFNVSGLSAALTFYTPAK